jgi:hypothetical protein
MFADESTDWLLDAVVGGGLDLTRFDAARFDAARFEAALLEAVLFDSAVADQLADELGEREVVGRITRHYREALPGRVRRLARACGAMDAERAMDAVLCLKVTSATVGASAMSGVAALVEQAVVERDWSSALGAISVVAGLAPGTDEALDAV